jgi:hypothetical protein
VGGGFRDLVFPWMYQIPYFRKEMAITISGLKAGLFAILNMNITAKESKRKCVSFKKVNL